MFPEVLGPFWAHWSSGTQTVSSHQRFAEFLPMSGRELGPLLEAFERIKLDRDTQSMAVSLSKGIRVAPCSVPAAETMDPLEPNARNSGATPASGGFHHEHKHVR
jgi:hypothetical protein